MANFDGLWENRLIYTTEPTGFPIMEHRMTFDVMIKPTEYPAVGTPFSDINYYDRDGISAPALTFLDNMIDLIKFCYSNQASFARWELWRFEEGSTDGVFITSEDIGVTGTHPNPLNVAWQNTLTFRSLAGGWAKIQLMESSFGGNVAYSPPYPGAFDSIRDVSLLAVSVSSPIVARDNSYIFSQLHLSNGQNEKLWRKRYRS